MWVGNSCFRFLLREFQNAGHNGMNLQSSCSGGIYQLMAIIRMVTATEIISQPHQASTNSHESPCIAIIFSYTYTSYTYIYTHYISRFIPLMPQAPIAYSQTGRCRWNAMCAAHAPLRRSCFFLTGGDWRKIQQYIYIHIYRLIYLSHIGTIHN
jgi:hypothetical protein